MTKLNIKMYGRSLYVYTLNKLLLLLLLLLLCGHYKNACLNLFKKEKHHIFI